jgi:hypothetical protein
VSRSNFLGVFAGDNDYLMNEHDLRRNGHKMPPCAATAPKRPSTGRLHATPELLRAPFVGACAVTRRGRAAPDSDVANAKRPR